MSHMLFGIDLGELTRPMMELPQALFDGKISQEEFDRRTENAARRAVEPKGRRTPKQP
jgi:hypothetical protein